MANLPWLSSVFGNVIFPIAVVVGFIAQMKWILGQRDARFPTESSIDRIHQELGGGRIDGIWSYGSPGIRLTLYRDHLVIGAVNNRLDIPLPAITSVTVVDGVFRRSVKIRFTLASEQTVSFVSKDPERLISVLEGAGISIAA